VRDQVQGAVGDIDIPVKGTAITGAQGMVDEISVAGWTSTIGTDLLGPIRLVSTFLPSLRKGDWGGLVMIASQYAVQP
jgi:NAD(P)-dependent dehydrogenase (short-subunit alcohol dehydrogenase family)